MLHLYQCGWWRHICMFHCRSAWPGRWAASRPLLSLLLEAASTYLPGSTQTEWDESRGQGTAHGENLRAGASPDQAGRWHMEELYDEEENHSCHEHWQRIWMDTICVWHLCCQLTLHLHLRVRLTIAMDVGCITDVLPWILAPHIGQCQNSIGDCVFPWQWRSEFGPDDLRRRGAWKKNDREGKLLKFKTSRKIFTHTCLQTPYRWPGTPLWRYVPPPLSFPWCSLMPVVLHDPLQQRSQLWPLSSPHCF